LSQSMVPSPRLLQTQVPYVACTITMLGL